MPIRDAQRQVIGVAQLVNKLDGTPFRSNDENLFEVSRSPSRTLPQTIFRFRILSGAIQRLRERLLEMVGCVAQW